MNIFRSKEVYKRIPKVSSEENPLRPVRGMWVSGEYRPPYCIDEAVHIQEISSKSAEVYDYTSRTQNIEDLEGVEYTNLYYPQIGFDVNQYSVSSVTMADELTVEYIGIYSLEFEILYYTQKTYNTSDDMIVEYLDVYTSGEFEITDIILPIYWNTTPDSTINIINFGSNEVVID